MSESNLKPTRWYYLVALLIPFCACFGAGMFVVLSIPNLPGALEGMGINDLTQVRVPGSAEILFPKAGGYAVYYEYRSLLNGEKFAGGPYPPEIDCRLSSRSTGEEVEISSNFVEGNTYSTRNEERVGVLIKSITIQKPGSYVFSCHYPDDCAGSWAQHRLGVLQCCPETDFSHHGWVTGIYQRQCNLAPDRGCCGLQTAPGQNEVSNRQNELGLPGDRAGMH